MKSKGKFIALRIVLFYALLAGIWILLSDRALDWFISDPHLLTTWQSYKGWAFVLVTAGLLYVLLDGQIQQLTREIAERIQAEELLRASLREKELLLRELYHRTRNNMQIIGAILMLQAKKADDLQVQQVFRKTNNRIEVMAMVHEKLYQSQSLSIVNLAGYIAEVAHFLRQEYHISPEKVSLVFDTEPVEVLFDIAIPCGLVLNELISNALQHAFPGDQTGRIRVCLQRTDPGELLLEVSDNGVGLPQDFDFPQDGNFGMQTISALVQYQLRGTLTFDSHNGVTCRIQFRDDLYEARV